MSEGRGRSRELRALFATVGVLALLAAGACYGGMRYQQASLERDATRDARKLTVDVLRPLLIPSDAQGPVRGARYEELLAEVRQRVLVGPVTGVRLWNADGDTLFSDDHDLVGARDPAMRADIHAAIGGASRSEVSGDRFRTFTAVQLGEPPVVLTVELDRSHASFVEEARRTWSPWFDRALVVAVACAGLYLLTAVAAGVAAGLRRLPSRRKAPAAQPFLPAAPRGAPGAAVPDPPAYMLPGFQDQVEARRRAEAELELVTQERDRLLERVRRLEAQVSDQGEADGEPERPSPLFPVGHGLQPMVVRGRPDR